MSSDGDVLEDDDTFVKYGDNGELVFHREERASMEELLAGTEDITSESDWSHHSSPEKPIHSSPQPTIKQQCSSRIRTAPVHAQEIPDAQSGSALLWAGS